MNRSELKSFKPQHPLRVEALFFIGLAVFFVIVTLIYAFWSEFEPVGTWGLGLLVGLNGLSGGYFYRLGDSIDPRPEEDPLAEVHEHAGEYGEFAPWSWWPFLAGVAVALIFLGPAIGQWWLLGVGFAFAILPVAAMTLEFNRGPHSH